MPKRKEFDTPTKARFYHAFDNKENGVSLAQICKSDGIGISAPSGRRWLKERDELGSKAMRSTRNQSNQLGRPPKLTVNQVQAVGDPHHPSHYRAYPEMIKAEDWNCSIRTVQRVAARIKGKRRKKGRTKAISKKNKTIRQFWGALRRNQTIRRYWQFVYFTDEVHFNSIELSHKTQYAFRLEGAEEQLEDLVEEEQGTLDVVLHYAGGINYNGKGVFTSYNDPAEPAITKVRKPAPPRKSKYETVEQFDERLKAHKATMPHDIEIQTKGNSMTQVFYTNHILNRHIEFCQKLKKRLRHEIYLQEDNDGSHGTRSLKNVARDAKLRSHLQNYYHPAQSPDLNPIEAIWAIIKQRLRGGRWKTVAEFKDAIEREWQRITLKQIRNRISEMVWRCEKVDKLKGRRVRSKKW